jgi:FkbM family methyltransferase
MEVYNRLIGLGYSDVRYYPVMMSERNFYYIKLLKESREKIDTVYSLLADEFSRTVFCNILKHRITMDFSCFNNIISEKQYFPSDIFNLGDRECFVDGGVYNGETIADFVSATNNNFDYIYGFEPDRKNYRRLVKELVFKDGERLKLFNSGLYSINGRAGFNGQGNSSSCICGNGEDTVSLVRLDDIIGEHKPTYIKLDIEGAEEEALYGMRETITKYHPRLAISVYHKASDLWELPLLIHSMSASYSLYLRHYSNGLFETVCYAI